MASPPSENRAWRRLAAALMMIGIALGAFGAHFLPKKLGEGFKVDVWDTAVFYHLIHGVALFILALRNDSGNRVTLILWAVGILFFSGSLYLLAVTSLPIGMITPLGGVAFMIGWATLVFRKTV